MASRAPVRFPGSGGPDADTHLSPQLRGSTSDGMGERLRLPGLYRRVSAWSDSGEDWKSSASVSRSDRWDEWSSGSERSGARAYSDLDEPSSPGRSSGRQAPLLRGIFQIQKRSCDVSLTGNRLLWSPVLPEHPDV